MTLEEVLRQKANRKYEHVSAYPSTSIKPFSVLDVDEWTDRRLLSWILDERNDKRLRSFLARVYVVRFEQREGHKSNWVPFFRMKKLSV